MPFDKSKENEVCPICGSDAEIRRDGVSSLVVNCSRCGEFLIGDLLSDRRRKNKDIKTIALASHLIRKMQASGGLPTIDEEFFASLTRQTLPTPVEAMDNLVNWLGNGSEGQFGFLVPVNWDDPKLISTVGVLGADELKWVVYNVRDEKWLQGTFGAHNCAVSLILNGWKRYSELRSAHIVSRYAFFARQFDNPDLDRAFKECLFRAVEETGYELRIVPQKAGPVDAIIEDGIRRCRFLIADLSDDNNGAYWEAGFAEGLGKPVIYLCRAKDPKTGEPKKRHFDTEHRHTVWWGDDIPYEDTATKLKAVIRNTLLGDANQSDD